MTHCATLFTAVLLAFATLGMVPPVLAETPSADEQNQPLPYVYTHWKHFTTKDMWGWWWVTPTCSCEVYLGPAQPDQSKHCRKCIGCQINNTFKIFLYLPNIMLD